MYPVSSPQWNNDKKKRKELTEEDPGLSAYIKYPVKLMIEKLGETKYISYQEMYRG